MSEQTSPKMATLEPFLLPRHLSDSILPPTSASSSIARKPSASDSTSAPSAGLLSSSVFVASRPDLDPDREESPVPSSTAAAQPTTTTSVDVPAKVGGKRWREDDDEAENCCICLQEVKDRTVMVGCGHDNFCFSCLCVWTDQSRKCPLCSHPIGPYLLHNLWTPPPFLKFFLPPLASKPSVAHPQHPRLPPPAPARRQISRPATTEEGGSVEQMEDEFERTVERRREVYRWGLLVKHVASNQVTRYRPVPTPQVFALNPDMISKATIWMRREFRVWSGVDVEFMLTYTLSLMKSVDIRSEPAVRLLAEFLDIGRENERRNAEQFVHEMYSFLRSPFRDLALYDASIQYDPIPTSATLRRHQEELHLSPRFRRENHHTSLRPYRDPEPQQQHSRRGPPLLLSRYRDDSSHKRPRRTEADEEDRRRDEERRERRRSGKSGGGGGARRVPPEMALALGGGEGEAGLGEAMGVSSGVPSAVVSESEGEDEEEDRPVKTEPKEDEGMLPARGRSRSRDRSGSVLERRLSPRSDVEMDPRNQSRSRSRSRSYDSRSRSRSWSRSRRSYSSDLGEGRRWDEPSRYAPEPRSPPRRSDRTDTWLSPEESERGTSFHGRRLAHIHEHQSRFPHPHHQRHLFQSLSSSSYSGPREMRPLSERRAPAGYGAGDVLFRREREQRERVELMDLVGDENAGGNGEREKKAEEARKKLGLGMRAPWGENEAGAAGFKQEDALEPLTPPSDSSTPLPSVEASAISLLRRISGIQVNHKPIPTGPAAASTTTLGARISMRGVAAARGRGGGMMSIRGAAGGGRLAQMSIRGAAATRQHPPPTGPSVSASVWAGPPAPIAFPEPSAPVSAPKADVKLTVNNPARTLLLRRLEEAKAARAAPVPPPSAADSKPNGHAPSPPRVTLGPVAARKKIDVGVIQKRIAEEKRRAAASGATDGGAGGEKEQADETDEAMLRRRLLAKLGR